MSTKLVNVQSRQYTYVLPGMILFHNHGYITVVVTRLITVKHFHCPRTWALAEYIFMAELESKPMSFPQQVGISGCWASKYA